ALVEQPTHKRRWYRPDYDAEERSALGEWLSERLEGFAKERREPFTVRQAAAALEGQPAVHAVGELLAGRPAFDAEGLVAECVRVESAPNQKHVVFTTWGLIKRASWERTWEQQHREDSGEKLRPEVSQSYTNSTDKKKGQTKDFLKPEYWKLRGPL